MSRISLRMYPLLFLAVAFSACGGASDTPPDSPSESATGTLTQFALPPENTGTLAAPLDPDQPTSEPAAPTLTPTSPPTVAVPQPVFTTGPLCDDAHFVSDVTIPDGTLMDPGASFKKVWKVKNVGTCDWNTSYSLAYASGEAMGGVATKIPNPIASGDEGEVFLDLVAPMVPGTHIGHWQMKNAAGLYFGVALFVEIVVRDNSDSWTATPLPPSATPPCDASVYVSDVTIPDGTEFGPGDSFRKTWKVRNTGSCNWTTAYTIAHAGGEKMDGVETHIPDAVDPGDETEIFVDLIAPSIPGNYIGHWQMKNAGGFYFGVVLFVQIIVR